MASSFGTTEDREDSGYLDVEAEGSHIQGSKSKDSIVKKTEICELETIKKLNKNLTKKIQALKKTLNDKRQDFEAAKMQLIRSHKKDIDKYKKDNMKMQNQVAATNSEMQLKEAIHKEEIQSLKAQIQLLESSETELSDKIKTLEATKYKHEYEQQKREMSVSHAELKKLKQQIVSLEKVVEERDAQIAKADEEKIVMTARLDRTIGEMTQNNEQLKSDMASMKNDLLDKLEEKDKSTKEMLRNIQGLLSVRNERQASVESSPGRQRSTALPPIIEQGSKSRTQSPSTHWKF